MRQLVPSILSTALAISLFTGCGPKTPSPSEQLEIDASLPAVNVTNHVTTMNSATFEWKSIKNPVVKGYYVYRLKEDGQTKELSRIKTIESRFPTHFTDTKLEPGTKYSYSFSSFSNPMKQSVPSKALTIVTKPVLTSVSFFEKVENLPKRAKLIWRPHTSEDVEYYIIERRLGDATEWEEVKKLKGRLHAEYIDTNLLDNSIYHYRIRALTFDGILSHPSDQVKVVTKPLPKMVQNLTATTDQPNKISLSWDPSTEKDFDHYRLYRSTSQKGGYDYHVKTHLSSHVDLNITDDGKVFFYKVTSVDKDGLQSPMQAVPVMGSTLVKPASPAMVTSTFTNKVYKLSWKKGDDRTVSYIVVKKTHTGWLSSETLEIKDIKDTQFVDMDVAADTSYEYQVIAVDKYGIRSKPTETKSFSYKAD